MGAPGRRRKLNDGTVVYDVSYRDSTGRKKMKTCYSAKQAREFHAEKVAEKRYGGARGDVRFGDFARQQHAFASMSQRDRTAHHHEQLLRLFLLPRFENVWLTKLTREMVEEFLIELRETKNPKTGKRKYSHVYLKNILKRLIVVLNAAVDRRLIQANPAARLAKLFKPIDDEAEPENSFTEEQLLRVLHCSKEIHYHCYPLFLLMARTGMRSGEALALEWSDVDFEERLIYVRQSLGRTGEIEKTKTREQGMVDMSEQLRTVLLELRNAQVHAALGKRKPSPKRLFPDTTLFHAAKQMKRVIVRLGLPAHFRMYSLRHTFGRLLMEKGVRIEEVQRRMRHKNIRMTTHYTKFAKIVGQGAVNRLDQPELDASNVVSIAREK